jgi:hypothetical protein
MPASMKAQRAARYQGLTELGLRPRIRRALAGRELVDAYVAAHGDPNKEFGFAETWIVGPTARSTFKIALG